VIATLIAKYPQAQPNEWDRLEYATVRRAFPGLDLPLEPYGGWGNLVIDHEAGYQHDDMRWRRWDGRRWNYL